LLLDVVADDLIELDRLADTPNAANLANRFAAMPAQQGGTYLRRLR
jgi:hypothetical protein